MIADLWQKIQSLQEEVAVKAKAFYHQQSPVQIQCREITISFEGCEEQVLSMTGYVNGERVDSLSRINNALSSDDERTLTLVCDDPV